MKKIISSLLVLIVCVCTLALPVSAATTEKEWTRMTGPAKFSVGADGARISGNVGTTFYKYTKDTVDITDFTCKFTLEQDNYWDGHDGGVHQYYYPMILTDKAAHSGSKGLFLLMFPTSGRSLRIEGQILNTGFLLSPSYIEFDVDTTSELVMHGKVVDGTHYEISFDNCKQTYKFEIPLNYQFHKDLDGQGYFGFGASVSTEGENIKMTVSSVNDLDFTGSEESKPAETEDDGKDETGSGTATDNSSNSSGSNANVATVSSTALVWMIAALLLLFIIVIAGFVVLILFLNKKLKE